MHALEKKPPTAVPSAASRARARPAAHAAGTAAEIALRPAPSFGQVAMRAPGPSSQRRGTSVQHHTLQASIPRSASTPPDRLFTAQPTRADAAPGQEHGGEAFNALFEQLGAAPESAANPARGSIAESGSITEPGSIPEPGSITESGSAAQVTTSSSSGTAAVATLGVPIRVPDIEVPALAAIGKSDAISGAFNYSGSIAHEGAAPRGFGVTRSFSSKLKDITITPGAGSFAVAATFEHPITYQIRSGTGPEAQVDIASSTDADITKANFATVASDLTPNMSDLNGRPPRTKFWSEDLTLKHEKVHADDDKANGPGAMATVTTWLNGKTAANAGEVTPLLNALPGRFATALLAALSTEDGEKHAYGDGAPSYSARANAIKAKGDKGDYA